MVALVAANVAITVNRRLVNATKRKSHLTTLVFGNGALTYPAGGVPLPTAQGFGFARLMEFLNLQDASNPDGYIYKYDQTNNKLRIYQGDNANAAAAPLIEVTTAYAPAATTLKAEAIGW